jgi:hypothetical protein
MVSEVKARQFAQAFVKNNMNASAAVREIEPQYRDMGDKKKQKVVGVKATRLLDNDRVKKSLKEVLEESGLNKEEISKLLKRNAQQDKNIPASNQAIDIAVKIDGSYAPEKSVKLNLSLEGNIDETINLLTNELNALKQLESPK